MVEAVRLSVVPVQTGPLLPATGAAGMGLTTAFTEPAAPVQPNTLAVTEQVPDAVVDALTKNREIEDENEEKEPWDQLHLIDYREIILKNWQKLFESDYTKPGEQKISGGKEVKTKVYGYVGGKYQSLVLKTRRKNRQYQVLNSRL